MRAAIRALGAGTLAEIAERAGLDRAECAPALDQLRILEEIELRDGGTCMSRASACWRSRARMGSRSRFEVTRRVLEQSRALGASEP